MSKFVNQSLRIRSLVLDILLLVITAGFVFQLSWAINFWPWPDGRLSYLFVGSILAAIAVAVLWIGWTGEWGALPAGALNVLVIAVRTTVYFLLQSIQGNHPLLLAYGIVGLFVAIASGGVFIWSRSIALQNVAPTPLFVRYSFGLFLVVLVLAGGALILKVPIFPWSLNPDSSVIFGCIFIGDAFYFFYGLLYPRWHNARGQLLSFLAYDLVLIFPFLALFTSVQPIHRLSLILYVAILLYSGLIALYYLLLSRYGFLHRAG